MSTISTGTSPSTAFNVNADTTGQFVVQTGASPTTALTINTSQALGVGSSASFGSSGQILTSNGSGAAPSWTQTYGTGGTTASGSVTLTSASAGSQSITPTGFGQFVKLPDATTLTSKASHVYTLANAGDFPLRIFNNSNSTLGFIPPRQTCIVGLSDNSTAAGVWALSNYSLFGQTIGKSFTGLSAASSNQNYQVVLDSNRTLFIIGGCPSTSAAVNTYAVVYDSSTNTWGTPTLVFTGASAVNFSTASLISTDKTLVIYTTSASGQTVSGVVLTTSGSTITVGSATTSGGAGVSLGTNFYTDILVVGSSYAIVAGSGVNTYAIAFTVSGTTVSVGAWVALGFTVAIYGGFVINSTTFMIYGNNGTQDVAQPVISSGTTLNLGSSVILGVEANGWGQVFPISSGARQLFISYDGSIITAAVVSLSGSIATASTQTLSSAFSGANVMNGLAVAISGSTALMAYPSASSTLSYVVLTDSSGTISAGTPVTYTISQASTPAAILMATSGTNASFAILTTTTAVYEYHFVSFATTTPVLSSYIGAQSGLTTAGSYPLIAQRPTITTFYQRYIKNITAYNDRRFYNSAGTVAYVTALTTGASGLGAILATTNNAVPMPNTSLLNVPLNNTNAQGTYLLCGLPNASNTNFTQVYIVKYEFIT
jgi:hypothetical protein